ncbi:hypothetical protein QZH41_007594 [Actinostola sp. cb2023]|nr:hypothetical protein QZH41_007594 [Actinostola sp. cb2023]
MLISTPKRKHLLTFNTAEQNQNIIIRGSNEGTITSPKLPEQVSFESRLQVEILGSTWSRGVKLYVDTININISSTRCSYKPYLRIIDGFKQLVSPLLRAVQCQYGSFDPYGLQRSFFVLSSAHKLEMHFLSPHDEVTGYGFKLNYTFESLVSFGDCKVQGQDNHLPLNNSNGILFSPRYPKGIPDNIKCTWVITVPEGSYVRLVFDTFDLDYTCSKKSELEIRDGSSPTSKKLGTYCGSKVPPSIISSGRQLWVRFTSTSGSSVDKGFNATYSTVSALPLSISCREQTLKKIESSSGQIASHDYPLKIRQQTFCVNGESSCLTA